MLREALTLSAHEADTEEQSPKTPTPKKEELPEFVEIETQVLKQQQLQQFTIKYMRHETEMVDEHVNKNSTRRWIMTGLATAGNVRIPCFHTFISHLFAGGATVIGLTAGLAAPLIGAGLTTVLGSIGLGSASAVLGSAGFITASGVVTGGGLTGYKMAQRTRGVKEFSFLPLEVTQAASVTLFVTGWLSKPDDFELPFSTVRPRLYGERYALAYESKALCDLGAGITEIATEVCCCF
jgi:hypothetical protein